MDFDPESFDQVMMHAEKCDPAGRCKRCLVCALELLFKLGMQGSMYTSLYLAYKFALTLSCTQVSCERVFSILKIVKNRLRSLLGQEMLDSFMMFYVNRNFEFDYESVVDEVASSSKELSRYLKL